MSQNKFHIPAGNPSRSANRPSTTVDERGNTTTVQLGADTGERLGPAIGASFGEGKSEVTFVDGVMTQRDLSAQQVDSDGLPNGQRGSILSSATTPQGIPTGNITDDSIVNVGGITMQVRSALALGLLQRDGRGGYVDPSEAPYQQRADQGARQSSQQGADQRAEEGADEPAYLGDTVEGFRNAFGEKMVDEMAQRFIYGGPEQAVKDFGHVLGVDTDQLNESFQGAYDELSGRVADHIKRAHNVDGRAALAWASRNIDPLQLREFALRYFSQGDVRGFDAIANEYKRVNKG